jgi:RNA polymerase sigma-70 factor (sigma-E family)
MRLGHMIEAMTTRGGEVQAPPDLRALYEAHSVGLFRLAVALTGDRTEADDIVQDAFVRLHRTPRPPAPEQTLAYLRRTVTNLVFDRHRRTVAARRLRPERTLTAPSAESGAVDADRSDRIAAAITDLPDRQRECVALHYFAGLTEAEVASTLGISVGSVKTHLHRARTTLAPRLEALR